MQSTKLMCLLAYSAVVVLLLCLSACDAVPNGQPDPTAAIVYNMDIGQGKVNTGTGVDFFSVRVSSTGFYGLGISGQGSCNFSTPIGSPADTKDILILGKVPSQISWEINPIDNFCMNLKQIGGGSDKLSLVDPLYYQNSQLITPAQSRVFVSTIEPDPIINTNYNSQGTAYTMYTMSMTAGVDYEPTSNGQFKCIIPKSDPIENLYFRLGFTKEKKGAIYQMWTDTAKPLVNGFSICGFSDVTITSYRLLAP